MKMIDNKEVVLRITEKLLEALVLPKPVLGLSRLVGEDDADTRNVLYSLRLLGVVVNLHGTKATLVCVLSPPGAAFLSERLAAYAQAASIVHKQEAQKIAAARKKFDEEHQS